MYKIVTGSDHHFHVITTGLFSRFRQRAHKPFVKWISSINITCPRGYTSGEIGFLGTTRMKSHRRGYDAPKKAFQQCAGIL